MWSFRNALLLLAVLPLGACGFEPIHARRETGTTVAQMAEVKIDRIKACLSEPCSHDRVGQQLNNALLNHLNPDGKPAQPLYRLAITLAESETPTAIGKDNNASRSNLSIAATYVLTDTKTGKVILSGTTTALDSYGIIINSYGTTVGQQDAERRAVNFLADDITTRVGLYFKRQQQPEAAQQ